MEHDCAIGPESYGLEHEQFEKQNQEQEIKQNIEKYTFPLRYYMSGYFGEYGMHPSASAVFEDRDHHHYCHHYQRDEDHLTDFELICQETFDQVDDKYHDYHY